MINQYANEKIITANPRKVSMKDKGVIPNSMVHAEEAIRIITNEGNRNFFFCLVSMWLSGLQPVYSSMVRKMNMPTITEAST
ncbi:MAG: hypothetical protein ACRD8W_05115 [Nitrososphaeraceae archaeon]